VVCDIAIVGEFLLSSASANTVVTTGATSTLQTPVAGPASIGFDWTVYGILNRVNADGGIYPPAGSVVKFTITRPDGQQTVINGTNSASPSSPRSDLCLPPASPGSLGFLTCRCYHPDHRQHCAGGQWRHSGLSDHQRRCGPHHCPGFVHERRRHLHRPHGVRR
jgi:hypothetical protein